MKQIDPMKELQAFVGRYPTKRAAAEAMGITYPYLHDLLLGQRRISDTILERLGLSRIEMVVKAS